MTTMKQLFDVANRRLETGSLNEAENLFLLIRERHPDDISTLHRLAEIAIRKHRYEVASELLAKVASARPDHSEVLTDLGRAYNGMGRFADAVTCLQRAAVLEPNHARIFRELAESFFALQKYDLAIENAARAIEFDPQDAEAYAVLGNAMLECRRPDRALACYEKSIELNPDDWKTWANRGMAFVMLNRLEESRDSLMFSNALFPMEPSVALPLASVLIDLCDHENASLLLSKLAAMMPNNPKVHLAAGINSFSVGDIKSAIAGFIKALSLDETHTETQLRLGEALIRDGKIENAVSVFSRLLEQNRLVASAYIQKVEAELLLGNVEQAGRTIEAMQSSLPVDIGIPCWKGEELTGKKILLYSRFGLDEFNILVRLADWVKQKGAIISVECTEPVRPLVNSMKSVDQTLLPGDAASVSDYHASLESILGMQGSFDVLTSLCPYFSISPALKEKWDRQFSEIKKLKIGLMWRKETHVEKNVYHSVPLSAFSPLFEIDGVHFVSLQTGTGLPELDNFRYKADLDAVGLENARMDERLACLAALDLLITPDTLTAEAASAAGLPVWVLLSTVPKWYWGGQGERSPLHPTARLFRQSTALQWTDVVESVASALRTEISKNRGT
jgi:tetratricopeptide (TPR) repeat protein